MIKYSHKNFLEPNLGLPHSKQVKKIEKVKDGTIENQPKVIGHQNFIGKKIWNIFEGIFLHKILIFEIFFVDFHCILSLFGSFYNASLQFQ